MTAKPSDRYLLSQELASQRRYGQAQTPVRGFIEFKEINPWHEDKITLVWGEGLQVSAMQVFAALPLINLSVRVFTPLYPAIMLRCIPKGLQALRAFKDHNDLYICSKEPSPTAQVFMESKCIKIHLLPEKVILADQEGGTRKFPSLVPF